MPEASSWRQEPFSGRRQEGRVHRGPTRGPASGQQTELGWTALLAAVGQSRFGHQNGRDEAGVSPLTTGVTGHQHTPHTKGAESCWKWGVKRSCSQGRQSGAERPSRHRVWAWGGEAAARPRARGGHCQTRTTGRPLPDLDCRTLMGSGKSGAAPWLLNTARHAGTPNRSWTQAGVDATRLHA